MTVYICKSCGRAMSTEAKPNFCYADRMDSIENISDEDAKRMGLFSNPEKAMLVGDVVFEFPQDIRFHPFLGNELDLPFLLLKGLFSLTEFQDEIMERVRA